MSRSCTHLARASRPAASSTVVSRYGRRPMKGRKLREQVLQPSGPVNGQRCTSSRPRSANVFSIPGRPRKWSPWKWREEDLLDVREADGGALELPLRPFGRSRRAGARRRAGRGSRRRARAARSASRRRCRGTRGRASTGRFRRPPRGAVRRRPGDPGTWPRARHAQPCCAVRRDGASSSSSSAPLPPAAPAPSCKVPPRPRRACSGSQATPTRFKNQTGQESQSPSGLPRLGPGPDLRLAVRGLSSRRWHRSRCCISAPAVATAARRSRRRRSPPARGDGYLVALSQAISAWGKGIYIRPMAEMNNAATFYSGYNANGSPKDAAHSPANYGKAFARIYLNPSTADPPRPSTRRLAQPRSPALRGGDLPANPFPRLSRPLEPAGERQPESGRQRGGELLPRPRLSSTSRAATSHDERLTDTAPWAGLEKAVRCGTRARQALLGPGVGPDRRRRSGVHPPHVLVREDARSDRRCLRTTTASRLAVLTSDRSREAGRRIGRA